MEAKRNSGLDKALWALAALTIMLPFLPPLVLVLSRIGGLEPLYRAGLWMLLAELYASPFLAVLALFCALAALRLRKPGLAAIALFGLLLNALGMIGWAFPTVAG